MFRRLLLLSTLLLAVLLSGCGGSPTKHPKVDMREEYGRAIRWGEWDLAWQFIDPATRTSATLPEDEDDRLKDVKVTGYSVHSAETQPDGTIKQQVEIHYIEQSTQRERSTRVTEVWRTDDDGEHWWLTTGLPEF